MYLLESLLSSVWRVYAGLEGMAWGSVGWARAWTSLGEPGRHGHKSERLSCHNLVMDWIWDEKQQVRMTHRLLHWAAEQRLVYVQRWPCLCLDAVSRYQQDSFCPFLRVIFQMSPLCPSFPWHPISHLPPSVAFIAIKGVIYFTNLSQVCLNLGREAYRTWCFVFFLWLVALLWQRSYQQYFFLVLFLSDPCW